MKKKRQDKILELIEKYPITTQEMLKEYLEKEGMEVTQATLSRDLNELDLRKQASENGNIYVRRHKPEFPPLPIFRDSVISVAYAMNMISIKCSTGMAQAVCATLDKMNRSEVLGTIAGDDTIFVLTESENAAAEFTEMLKLVLSD